MGSPFPYHENVTIELADDLPDPKENVERFETESAQKIKELCLANSGRALILCTSWRFVTLCRSILASSLTDAGITLLVQGDAPLPQLLQQKREDATSVLLGTDSLWEGIDIPGDAVTLVILTRFPFPVPSHPLTAARMAEIERNGQSSFQHYSLPLAILKFRQGFGRLVRSSKDKGRVVILDPRARRKRYGRQFLDALPRCKIEEEHRG